MLSSVMNNGMTDNSMGGQHQQRRAVFGKADHRKIKATPFLPQKCMGCDDTNPPTGFAPIFDTDGVEGGEESFHILLCQECYSDYDQGFEKLLVAKLRLEGQKGNVSRN